MATEKTRIDNVPERKALMECIERGQATARATGEPAYSARVAIIWEIENVFHPLKLKEGYDGDYNATISAG